MIQRSDVEFSSQGITCRAWLYTPARPNASPTSCIVMAPGLGGTRDAGLEPYAHRFVNAGYFVLLFDYRHFGASDGEPRQLLSISRQLNDWAAAIVFARRQPGIDPRRIALWGTPPCPEVMCWWQRCAMVRSRPCRLSVRSWTAWLES